jgi:energy-coupling factor transporter ATP-binding protein EcfA2
VAAFYLLALLTGVEARGLPGAIINRIKFQRGDEGHPMDDLIIDAHDIDGQAMGLDLQTKRSITFAPQDAVFEKVAGQIARSILEAGLPDSRTLGVATAQISRKIAGPYQDILTWAREIGSASVFHARLARKGAAGPDMVRFVETLRRHLAAAGANSDDESLWRLLRRLRILVFDFTTEDSANLALARQQCALALHPDDAARGPALWSALMALALETDAVGGDIDRPRLLEKLRAQGFRLAGDRRSMAPRRALAEAAKFALESIDDSVAGASLLRPERLKAVHAALDAGRYVEVRGAGGVGKSGLLKHLARSVEAESALLVLRPTRVIPRGWAALRDNLGYDGSAGDLLAELAASGGGLLLIDNVEGYAAEERATVVDLVLAAAKTPGVSVLVTARPDFGVDEPSWLPAGALQALGRAPAVVIDELSDHEVAALKAAAPALSELLADGHPARAVVRNLFRLKRLARFDPSAGIHTELELARRWWEQADGDEPGRRDRARLLRRLGEEALALQDRSDVTSFPSDAVDALVRSETLAEAQTDRVVFRHDVLRDWAVFNCLRDTPGHFAALPLARPAPPSLVRGFELHVRGLVSDAADGSAWRDLLERLQAENAHGSWRRTALLGVVRADDAPALFSKLLPELLARDGALLQELIRTVMAVEVQPADAFYAALGFDASMFVPGMAAPQGPAWLALTRAVAAIAERLPAAAIPSVVGLYTQWLIVTANVLKSSTVLVRQIHGWLVDLRGSNIPPAATTPDRFAGLSREIRDALGDSLRIAFVAFASAAPDLAKAYIAELRAGRRSSDLAESAVMFCGSLPQAAPAEYADLVAHLLIEPLGAERDRGGRTSEPFTFLDHRFLPESPSQGPFLTLLRADAGAGLALIRRLVDHEIAYDTLRGRPADNDFEIGLETGRRRVRAAWAYSYSRGQARGHAVGSALMALEAWAHDRVEAGDGLGAVIDRLIGDPDVSAPFILVAVDLILSHWSEPAAEKALDFVASPELLVLDRERQGREMFGGIDMNWFGLGSLNQEPGKGRYTAAALRERASRQTTLERTLPVYFAHVPSRRRLADHYAAEKARLGDPPAHAAFGHPAFMAAYVANLMNPRNWVSHDGPQGGLIYRAPAKETEQLERLRAGSGDDEITLRLALTSAVDAETPADATLVDAAAKRLAQPEKPADGAAFDDDRQIRAQAALVIVRDANDDLWRKYEETVETALRAEIERPADRFGGDFSQLRYNPPGLAFLGLIYLLRRRPGRARTEAVLRVASTGGLATAQGFGDGASVLAQVEPRLVVSVLRCALTGSRMVVRRWGDDESQTALHRAVAADRDRAVERELAWLFDGADEPAWPSAAARRPRSRRRGLSAGGADPALSEAREGEGEHSDHFFHQQAAAGWLRGALRPSPETWVGRFVSAYASWTLTANGLGLDPFADSDPQLSEWNRQFSEAAIQALANGSEPEVTKLVLTPLARLPDRAIHELGEDLLKSLDYAVFAHHAISAEAAAPVRKTIAAAVMGTRGWRAAAGRYSTSIEHGLGPATAALFFCDYLLGQGPTAYLQEKGAARLGPFLPQIADQAAACPSYFVALAFLSLAEVSPSPQFLDPALVAGEAWMAAFPDHAVFWSDQGTGRRLCRVLESALFSDAGPTPLEDDRLARLERLLSRLVALGVKEAFALEHRLTA